MILLGGIPTGIVLGNIGWLPADVPAGSPVADDFDLPADAAVEFAWWLTTPLVASGLTLTSDQGAYNLIGAAVGVHVQGYGLLLMPPAGAPAIEYSTITTTVGVAPAFTSQPQPQSATEGGSATFSVAVTGTAPVALQWRRNGVAISGATGASYTATGLALADNGAVFSVVASNALGSATSAGAVLTVTEAVAGFALRRLVWRVERRRLLWS